MKSIFYCYSDRVAAAAVVAVFFSSTLSLFLLPRNGAVPFRFNLAVFDVDVGLLTTTASLIVASVTRIYTHVELLR